MPRPDELAETLDRLLATAQREDRMPSVVAAVFRDGEILWERALGLASVDPEEPATPAHAYRIGSITKTFTAVCVLQLREAGLLELDTPLRDLVPEAPVGPTVRQALSHLTGLQREPPGQIWETLEMPSREDILGGLEDAERVLRAGERFHYSNLVFSLLGEVVARKRGSYAGALQAGVLEPLGLARTALVPTGPRAQGYYVEPWSDGVRPERDVELPDPPAAMGQLWSTAADLARYGAFLAAGDDRVLPAKALDEMSRVQTMVDQAGWTAGWGLGLMLFRHGERVYVGHGGAMPGFLAMVLVNRAERTGAVVLTNSSSGPKVDALCLRLAEAALDAFQRTPEAWRPAVPPDDVVPLLGIWWTEGHQAIVSFRDGRLQVLIPAAPAGRNVAYLEREGDDAWRIVDGYECGERVLVDRAADGSVEKLSLATYPLRREPSTF